MNKKNIAQFVLLIAIMILSISVAHAAGIDPSFKPENQPGIGAGGDVGSGTETISATIFILQVLTGALLYFAAPVAVIVISLNGFQIITGGADTEKLEQGKKNLTWSIAGLLLIILSYSIVKILIGIIIEAASGGGA